MVAIELTPAVTLSLIGVLVVLGGLIWRLSAKVEQSATRDEINARETQIRKDFDMIIRDRTKDSVQEHASLASKETVAEVKEDLGDFKKEVNSELKSIHTSLNTRFELISRESQEIQNKLVKILHYVSPKGGASNG